MTGVREVWIFGKECPTCGESREATAGEAAYEAALETLIRAARALGRSEDRVRWDLAEWFRWLSVEERAALDPATVRLWWARMGEPMAAGEGRG